MKNMLMMEMKPTIFRKIKCIRSTRRPVPLSLGRETHWYYDVHAIYLNVVACKEEKHTGIMVCMP
jgi:hypothetical protein